MKANELRIGNLIQDKKGPEVTIITVAHIGEGTINYWMESVYQSIPLSPEWLEKFGFKLVDETMGSGIEGIKGPYYAHEALLLWYNGSEPKNAYLVHYGQGSSEKYTAVQGRWIHSVHELQNVFHSWKGKELTQI